ncbi:hypothetical protein [Kitasatospora sp. NPDC018619]|uniref:hypothetical protein n=1 Tax=unclassified Kitasatospora TaxID=2633591 RepID=UPI003798E8A6
MRRTPLTAAPIALAAVTAVALAALAAVPAGAVPGPGAFPAGASPAGAPTAGSTPAGASPAAPASGHGGGWEPAPTPPADFPAGSRCDAPVHMAPVVDEVQRRVLEYAPDGTTVRRAAFRGALVLRLTNTATGARYDADAGGRAVVDYRPDGSQTWHAHGPVLLGVSPGGGNLPRDLYTVDGDYTIDISATGYRTVTIGRGSAEPLCAKIS